ncbi:Y-family DNA polymerase [Teredinibacter haidensis]|uniref:Y-family DNA polymerase n=1 Tax=Teredinibacter haidensis TaxID=2731755 RepID=UPI000948B430|nr:DNA polymerase Y family protein [Teredinibacter haidensis]
MKNAAPKRQEKYWLAIRLPQLPLEVFGFFEQDPTPVVVCDQQNVICCNPQAEKQGVTLSMSPTTAQILCECQRLERDKQQEEAVLDQFAEQLYLFTPYIEQHLPSDTTQSGFTIEISRSLTLFKGLLNLIARLEDTLKKSPHNYRLGLGYSATAAWVLSYTNQVISGNEDRQTFLTQLHASPIERLSLCPQNIIQAKKLAGHIANLDKSGFSTLGDIAQQIEQQSLAGIRKRWGQNFSRLLMGLFNFDQQLNQPSLFEKPAEMYQPKEFFFDSIQFDYPISNIEQLIQPMEFLLQQLSQHLKQRQQQSQKIEWILMDIYHNKQKFQVFTSEAQSQWPLWLELSQIQLEAHTLTFEVDSLELSCRNTHVIGDARQTLNFDGQEAKNKIELQQDFAITTAKLRARLGDNALFKIAYRDSHLPEHSNLSLPVDQHSEDTAPEHQGARPSWLFDSPLPVEQRRENLYWRGKLTLLQGPERIEGNWWQQACARDYFIAQRDDYLRLWVFYDLLKKSWFVQGVFG